MKTHSGYTRECGDLMEDNIELQLEEILQSRTGPSSRSEMISALESTEKALNDYRLEHTRRVVKLAKRISKEMKADTKIITLAAWLHDISKPGISRVENHGIKSAKVAAEILESQGFDKNTIDRVEDTICKHVGLTLETQLEPIEAQILWEADKLDKLGIVGYLQGVLNWARMDVEKTMNDLAKNLRDYFPLAKRIAESMFTPLGIKIAQERYDHMKALSSRLDHEISGHHGEDLLE